MCIYLIRKSLHFFTYIVKINSWSCYISLFSDDISWCKTTRYVNAVPISCDPKYSSSPTLRWFQQQIVAYHRDQVETNIDESSRRYQGTIRGHVKNENAQLFKPPKYFHMSNGFHKVFHCPNVHLVFDGVVWDLDMSQLIGKLGNLNALQTVF